MEIINSWIELEVGFTTETDAWKEVLRDELRFIRSSFPENVVHELNYDGFLQNARKHAIQFDLPVQLRSKTHLSGFFSRGFVGADSIWLEL